MERSMPDYLVCAMHYRGKGVLWSSVLTTLRQSCTSGCVAYLLVAFEGSQIHSIHIVAHALLQLWSGNKAVFIQHLSGRRLNLSERRELVRPDVLGERQLSFVN